MTATTAPSVPLELVMRERWDQAPPERRSTGSVYDDDVTGAIESVLHTVMDSPDELDHGYHQWEDFDDGSDRRLGDAWITELMSAAHAAGKRAFDLYVVPAIISEIVARLPAAPAELVNHPHADVLRADLAALGVDR